MLELRNIQKGYDVGPTRLEVLRGVELAAEKGEMVSIMGKSGCGKSTLMNIIGLLDRPCKGDYILDGQKVDALHDDDLSRARNELIGFVFQSHFLLPKLSAVENVCLPLVYRGISPAVQKRKAMEMLEKVGMARRAGHRPNELSGGQSQRVAIARSLVGAPGILLADEPTGALDPRVGREIMDLFIRLNREEAITILIITHDPGVAERCGRTLVMRDGLLWEDSCAST